MIFGKLVNKYYIKYWYRFLLGFIALGLVDYYQLQIPQAVQKIIDGIDKGTLVAAFLLTQIGYISLFALVIIVGRFFWRIFIFGASRKIGFDIRNEMFLHNEKLSNEYYSRHKVGGLMAHYTNDLEAVRNAMGPGLIMIFDALFMSILTFYLMMQVNVKLTVVAAIPLLLLAVFGGIIGAYLRRRFKELQQSFEGMSDFTNENFSGISVIKAFVKEKIESEEFDKLNQTMKDKTIQYVKLSTLFDIFIRTLISLVFVILIAYGGYIVVNTRGMTGAGTLSISELVLLIQYFGMLIWPMLAIGMVINRMSQGNASRIRIEAILNAEIDVFDSDDLHEIDSLNGNIEFKDLSFTYPGETNPVLKDISFQIKQGELVGIIGRTGSGKTSLVDLLLRIYNIQENTLLLDGYDIMHLPIKKIRNQIGYVPQDGFLFSDTINNNISLGIERDGDYLENIISSAKLSDVHDNITEFSEGYQTIVGERGVTLSGGQRQRISIARALIKEPPILILDDSVSAVDTNTEEKILKNLKKVRQNKTTILIAHRISTIKDANKIIVIDDGQLIGIGTHKELLSSCEFYKDMVERQKLEDELEAA
ncbi:MAG: ABC transporter ATP-binding protein [Bacilli bacterium]|nr:ABC transporter ATP-binding protein [Bacilli bacterium]MBN2876168.1 ABC transporter ATP-binding protein [Bacilli bacterium]